MAEFFKKSQSVDVSQLTVDGWWLGNCIEHVVKGTALGADFTQVIYTPSTDGMIARFDRETEQWSDEIEDMTWKPFFDAYGRELVIGEPDGDYPEWAIKETPPEYDKETQTVLYRNNAWEIFNIELGKPYWDSEANELIISDYNFTLPDNHSFIEPPKADKGFAVRLVNGEWKQLEDHREQIAFAKDPDDEKGDYQVETLGPIPETHTLLPRAQYDSWNEALGLWEYDKALYLPTWINQESQWQQSELLKTSTAIEHYKSDVAIPDIYSELRVTQYTGDNYYSLLGDRKLLVEYLQQRDFPDCGRPILSGLTSPIATQPS